MGSLTGGIGDDGLAADVKLVAETRFPTARECAEVLLLGEGDASMEEAALDDVLSAREKRPIVVGRVSDKLCCQQVQTLQRSQPGHTRRPWARRGRVRGEGAGRQACFVG